MFKRFQNDRRGNVVQIFALAIIPLIGSVGIAVDYSRASSARTALQGALDSTALYLAKEAGRLTAEQLSARAQEVFAANFNRSEARAMTVNATFSETESGWNVKVTAAGKVDATITSILGHDTTNIGGSAEVAWGMKKLELVLALDNTGSMSSNNKMTELKTAAKTLLTTLQGASLKPDHIKVSIVPFATDVNVGTANKTATWLDWSEWDAANGYLGCPPGATPIGNSGKCRLANGNQVQESWQADHDTWKGCVTDRAKDHDVLDTTPTSMVTKFVPHQASNCPVELLALTNSWSTLSAKIDSMTPTGNTNVTIGLAWAWHALTGSLPLTQAAAVSQNLDKIIILLTDGDNTQNRWSNIKADIDARTKLACANVKAAGISLYTIRVINGDAALLQECASSPSMYYDVQNASQLSSIFNQIAKNLANLRLAK